MSRRRGVDGNKQKDGKQEENEQEKFIKGC
jgi:hypothetical protein